MPNPFDRNQVPTDLSRHILSFLPTPDRVRLQRVSHGAQNIVDATIQLEQRFRNDVNALEARLERARSEMLAYLAATAAVIAVNGHPQRVHYIGMGHAIRDDLDRIEADRQNLLAAFQSLAGNSTHAAVVAQGMRLTGLANGIAAVRMMVTGRTNAVFNALDMFYF